jgi:hypothetical protein
MRVTRVILGKFCRAEGFSLRYMNQSVNGEPEPEQGSYGLDRASVKEPKSHYSRWGKSYLSQEEVKEFERKGSYRKLTFLALAIPDGNKLDKSGTAG